MHLRRSHPRADGRLRALRLPAGAASDASVGSWRSRRSTQSTLRQILLDGVMRDYKAEFDAEGLSLEIDDAVLDHVVKKASKRELGARGLHASLVPFLEEAAYERFGDTSGGGVRLSLDGEKIRVGRGLMIDAQRAFRRLFEQHALGPRFVGSAGHRAAHGLLHEWLSGADELSRATLRGAFLRQPRSSAATSGRASPASARGGCCSVRTSTHDRLADRDPDEGRRRDPVPGANDGASGTALLAELAVELAERRDRPSVDIVLFDAEDWHEIDGKEVSLGARRFVAELDEAERPDAVIIVDMVAGRDLMLDVDRQR